VREVDERVLHPLDGAAAGVGGEIDRVDIVDVVGVVQGEGQVGAVGVVDGVDVAVQFRHAADTGERDLVAIGQRDAVAVGRPGYHRNQRRVRLVHVADRDRRAAVKAQARIDEPAIVLVGAPIMRL